MESKKPNQKIRVRTEGFLSVYPFPLVLFSSQLCARQEATHHMLSVAVQDVFVTFPVKQRASTSRLASKQIDLHEINVSMRVDDIRNQRNLVISVLARSSSFFAQVMNQATGSLDELHNVCRDPSRIVFRVVFGFFRFEPPVLTDARDPTGPDKHTILVLALETGVEIAQVQSGGGNIVFRHREPCDQPPIPEQLVHDIGAVLERTNFVAR